MISIAKSQPAPECLETEKAKTNGDYRCGGVLARNKADFFNKCYICEFKWPTEINTEHFVPHRGNIDLKFDWNNLFFACAHCNNLKSDDFDAILNCTVAADNVETNIKYHIDPYPKESAVFTAQQASQQIDNTIRLLNLVFNGSTQLKILQAANLRSHLLKEIRLFLDLLFDYDDEDEAQEKDRLRDKLITQLRPSSNFAAFKRWVIRDHSDHFPELLATL